MRTEPITINGLAGPLIVDMNTITGRSTVTVGGVTLHSTGRGNYQLPTANGSSVPARVRASLLDPYPIIEINRMKHRTGPAMPTGLRVLSLLPLALLLVGGALGGLLGGIGAVVNLAVARSEQSTAAKALLMILVLAGAAIGYLIVAAAIFA